MAVRQNPSLPNRHTGYIACSGYGKSQALKQNADIPRSGVRVLLWDPDEDHKATRFVDRHKFLRAVIAGMKSGKGFRIAWSGRVDVDTFEWFCQVVWQCLDGERLLYCIVEELADVQPSTAKATDNFGQLCRRGRKYGLQLHWASQRSEEISKTVTSQTGNFYIGYPNDSCPPSRVDELARLAKCPNGKKDLYALQPLQFWCKKGTQSKLITLKYKNL